MFIATDEVSQTRMMETHLSDSMEQDIQKAIQLLSAGKATLALEIISSLRIRQPENGRVLEVQGHCYLALGNQGKATEFLLAAHRITPRSANITAYLGGIYHGSGQLDKALEYFAKTVELNPTYHQAWHFQSLIYFQQDRLEQGLICLVQAQENDPFSQFVQEAQKQYELGQTEKAVTGCQRILQQHRSHPGALSILAGIALQGGQLEQAEAHLLNALNYSPYDKQCVNMIAQVYGQLRQYTSALIYSEKLTRIAPTEDMSWQIHADNLLNAGKFEDALGAFEKAYEAGQQDASMLLQQAHVHKILGNNNEAVARYLSCTDTTSTEGAAYWGLANFRDIQFSSAQLERLTSIPLAPESDLEQACQASFALAKHHEDIEEYDRAFALYLNANANRPGSPFSPKKYAAKCNALMETFNADILCKGSKPIQDSVKPIFIVGLPRSGSTLVEQILASHSQVEGTMELKTLPALARKIYLESCQKNGDNSGRFNKFTANELTEFGNWYLQESEIYRTDKPYFIDKLPPNFQHIGLIHMILPQAIIIDARRQPMACGMGIFKQHFGHGHDFSYNLRHIGFYYKQYLKLMDYWHSALPGKVYTLHHEQLVLDTETQIKDLLAHCQLEFEPECLAFHLNKRAVRTASSDQVRRPISKDGLDLWERYQTQLNPLVEALGEETLKRCKS